MPNPIAPTRSASPAPASGAQPALALFAPAPPAAHAPSTGLRVSLPGLPGVRPFGAEADVAGTGLHLRVPARTSAVRRAAYESYADVVRRCGSAARAEAPAEQHQAKRARVRDPSPPAAATPAAGLGPAPAAVGAVTPSAAADASPRARFETMLAEARRRQPVEAAKGWEEHVCRLCLTSRGSGIVESSVRLLEALTRVPAAAQVPLAMCAHELCAALERRPSERLQVVSMLAELVEYGGTAHLEDVVACLRPLVRAARRRQVLRAVHDGVPAASRLHFLRMAEVLLRAGHEVDVAAVCEAAARCHDRVRARGLSWEERRAQRAAPSPGASTSPVAPPFTDEDWAILEALQQEALEEFDEASEARFEERFTVQLAARRRRGGTDVDGDTDVASNASFALDWPSDTDAASDGRASPAPESEGAHAAEADAAETLRLVQRARTENVQDQERIRLLKAAWAFLGQRYRRELPEEAMFLLVKGAYDVAVREARRGQGPYAVDALPRLEKEWPSAAPPARQVELLAEQAPLLAHQALTIVFEGRQDGRMAAIVDDDVMAHHLDEEGLGARGFVAILWSIIHRRGEGAPVGSARAKEAALQRDILRHGFWGAMLDNVLVKVLTNGQRRPRRLCHNGLAQRLLTALEGYEPITVTPTMPLQLLTQLAATYAEEVEAAWGENEPPTASVTAFVASARALSRQAFGETHQATFERHLVDYVRWTYAQSAAQALQH